MLYPKTKPPGKRKNKWPRLLAVFLEPSRPCFCMFHSSNFLNFVHCSSCSALIRRCCGMSSIRRVSPPTSPETVGKRTYDRYLFRIGCACSSPFLYRQRYIASSTSAVSYIVRDPPKKVATSCTSVIRQLQGLS